MANRAHRQKPAAGRAFDGTRAGPDGTKKKYKILKLSV